MKVIELFFSIIFQCIFYKIIPEKNLSAHQNKIKPLCFKELKRG